MVYKRFTFQLFLRLAIIVLLLLCFPLLIKFFDSGQMVFTFLVLSLLVCLMVINLAGYVDKNNRRLSDFLEHIQARDFSIHFNDGKYTRSEKELYKTFNGIIDSYKNIKIEKEVQFRFLQHIVELIDIGIIARKGKDNIVLMNTAAKSLLGIRNVLYWTQLGKTCKAFTGLVDGMEDRKRALLESGDEEAESDLVIHVNRTHLLDEEFTIIAFQNIKTEIEKREAEAWLKLIRTLNHEIKNSVTPISSLTETILMIIQEKDGQAKSPDRITSRNLEDIIHSVKTLEKRSANLYDFVSEFNKLIRIPEPRKELTRMDSLLDETYQLFKADLEKSNIQFAIRLHDPEFSLPIDPVLIQQVLINLVKNSMEALQDITDKYITDKYITVSTYLSESDQPVIKITDNGQGIAADQIDQVFIPFFSTKEPGSGIGLALVRHVMTLHGGSVSLRSQPGTGTKIFLKF